MTFWQQYGVVVAFYAIVILLLLIFRKRFDWQGVVGLLRTNWGVSWMQRFGEKNKRWIIPLAYVGIYVGFAFMLVILGFLFYGLYQLLFVPSAPAVLTPVLPGIKVPGSPITFPLFETLIALFFVIVIHEGSHGIVAAAHGLKVKASGLLVMGPIFGAFVEPDEKKLVKRKPAVQHAIYAAGPWSNIIFAAIFFGLVIGFGSAVSPLLGANGMSFDHVMNNSPAQAANLPANVTFTATSEGPLRSSADLLSALDQKHPGDTITFIADNTVYNITLGEHPQDATQPWIGIEGISTSFALEQRSPFFFNILAFLQSTLYWMFVVSLGLGMANLIPLGPVDGGRMYQLLLRKWFGEKKGDAVWAKTATALLALVAVLVIVPITRASWSVGAGIVVVILAFILLSRKK